MEAKDGSFEFDFSGIYDEVELYKIIAYTLSDMPSDDEFPITDETKNLVLHAEIKIKDSTLMFSDVLPGMPFVVGNNISLTYAENIIDTEHMESIVKLERI